MRKKKIKTTKSLPKFSCCGEETSSCSRDKKNVEVYVCPKCQSTEVGYSFGFKNLFGIIPLMKCRNCGFEGMSFPKWFIDKTKLGEIEKKALKNEKTEKVGFGTKIEESYCPNCKDEIKIAMKDGNVNTFICENCKFEIKGKKKK